MLHSVTIKWLDDESTMDVLISDCDDICEECDDHIFYYGIDEQTMKRIVAGGEACEDEWTIIEYHGVWEQ